MMSISGAVRRKPGGERDARDRERDQLQGGHEQSRRPIDHPERVTWWTRSTPKSLSGAFLAALRIGRDFREGVRAVSDDFTAPGAGVLVRSRPKTIERLGAAIVFALSVRVLYVFARYMLNATSTHRFDVETATLIFVSSGLVFRLVRSRQREHEPPRPVTLAFWTWLAFCSLAIAFYWSALSVGFLSDDFVLATHARRWQIGPVTPALFRPLPLLVWAALLNGGAGAPTLHLVNIVLHGTNAFLTARVVARWVHDRTWSLLAGLVMLTAPLAPEAVVWCSGVFDLFATTLVLLCVLIARRYDDHPSVATRIAFVAVGLAAVASKETAAVAAGLVLVDAWARRAVSRALLVDIGALVGTVGVFGLVRLASAFGPARPPLSKYLLQRAVFGSVGGLAVPWHVDVIRGLPWLPILGVLAVLYLVTVFLLGPGSMQRTKCALAAALWILLPIVPVFPIFFIAPDLQAARYLYLPLVGWAALLAVVASEPHVGRYQQGGSRVAILGLVVITAYGAMRHQEPWREAARMRDRVEASALDVRSSTCPTMTVSHVPDSVRGAYVFRNGVPEAFEHDLRLNVSVGHEAGPCAFLWSDARLAFVPLSP